MGELNALHWREAGQTGGQRTDCGRIISGEDEILSSVGTSGKGARFGLTDV